MSKIEVECLSENEDGSMNVMLHLDAESTKCLITYGFLNMVKDAIKEGRLNTVDVKAGETD